MSRDHSMWSRLIHLGDHLNVDVSHPDDNNKNNNNKVLKLNV